VTIFGARGDEEEDDEDKDTVKAVGGRRSSVRKVGDG
jgi:hypothetical protein